MMKGFKIMNIKDLVTQSNANQRTGVLRPYSFDPSTGGPLEPLPSASEFRQPTSGFPEEEPMRAPLYVPRVPRSNLSEYDIGQKDRKLTREMQLEDYAKRNRESDEGQNRRNPRSLDESGKRPRFGHTSK